MLIDVGGLAMVEQFEFSENVTQAIKNHIRTFLMLVQHLSKRGIRIKFYLNTNGFQSQLDFATNPHKIWERLEQIFNWYPKWYKSPLLFSLSKESKVAGC